MTRTLSAGEKRILGALAAGPMTVGQVATHLHRSPSTVSTCMLRLFERGLVKRTASIRRTSNGRAAWVYTLTGAASAR